MAVLRGEPLPKGIPGILARVDLFQQRHSLLGFIYAVQKKYDEDEAGYEGALITYYGFLSLFPLLFILLSLLQLSIFKTYHLRNEIISVINQRLPILGSELQANIHSKHRAGIALVVSLLITLYGARSVANAFQHALDRFWLVPKAKRVAGVKGALQNLGIIVVGGVAIILATILSTFATSFGRSDPARAFSLIVSMLTIFGLVLMVFRFGASITPPIKKLLTGSLVAAVGLQVIQIFGSYLVLHELKKLSSLYGSFAIALGILFWIYIQVRIVLYAAEINTVRSFALWPRSFTGSYITPQDEKAKQLYAHQG